MHANRLAALTQTAVIAATITTANRPINLGWVNGPWTITLGWTAVTASLAVLLRPTNIRTQAATAGLCTTWWTLRAIDLTLDTIDGAPLTTAAAVHAALAIYTALFAYRSIVRHAFNQRLDQAAGNA